MDTEGNDIKVLQGATSIIENGNPIIIMEYTPNLHTTQDKKWFTKFIKKYNVYDINNKRNVATFNDLPSDNTDLLLMVKQI
jgi:hypothetical protein